MLFFWVLTPCRQYVSPKRWHVHTSLWRQNLKERHRRVNLKSHKPVFGRILLKKLFHATIRP
jgi:hypothetical protein